ncbi:hypothetical protein DENSPDRAFT_840620 [Dentipellis sp. KUC8613]|nr:hypothetical protein DENSPDRAFT_840620 [Dentipellis sp. KUC8613]
MSPDPLQPPSTPPPSITTILPLHDPPPPYPSRERRSRTGRRSRRSGTVSGVGTTHTQQASASTESDPEGVPARGQIRSAAYTFPDASADDPLQAVETTPLLGVNTSPRPSNRQFLRVGGVRPRTVSQSSTVFSGASVSPSLAQTVISALRMEDSDLDYDGEAEDEHADGGREVEGEVEAGRLQDGDGAERLGSGVDISRRRVRRTGWRVRWKRYWRPLGRGAYWTALFHLLVLNFPYALVAFIFLFVFTVLGTTLLVALPLGAVLCFFDLLGARVLSRGEVLLQSKFHGPLAYDLVYPLPPIFSRIRPSTSVEIEAGVGTRYERSFYRNSYSMFTDSTSYHALFYFLVIKPSITILLSLLLIVLVPLSVVLVLPAPAMLRLVRRLGIWQANVAVEGLYVGGW